MAAVSRQQQQQQHLTFDGHQPPPNGLWRPALRPFIGKYQVSFPLVNDIVIRYNHYLSSPPVRSVISNYNRFILITLTFPLLILYLILQLKVKMCTHTHKHIRV
jgi:hypothetical protein